jgi:hypothetical protein
MIANSSAISNSPSLEFHVVQAFEERDGGIRMISPVVFGAIIDASGRWDYPFIASLCLLLVGAVSALFLRPDVPFEGPQKA